MNSCMSSTLTWVHQMVSESMAYLGHLPTRKFTEEKRKKHFKPLKTFDHYNLDLLQIGTSIHIYFLQSLYCKWKLCFETVFDCGAVFLA